MEPSDLPTNQDQSRSQTLFFRSSNMRHFSAILALVGSAGLFVVACGGSETAVTPDEPERPARPSPPGCDEPTTPVVGGGGAPTTTTTVFVNPELPKLEERVFDYGAAYRYASLALTGDLPNLVDIKALAAAAGPSQKAKYEEMVDLLVTSPKFAVQVRNFWRNTFKTGGEGLDSAANFAAQVVVGEQPYTTLFTKATGTCPTLNEQTGVFAAADCAAGAPTAGVLTNPALMKQFDSNMSFRRARFVQEVFTCSKFPAERSATPVKMGGTIYTSPWPFDSITGKKNNPQAKVDFQDTATLMCANCHTTMNHVAPLFAFFREDGSYNAAAMVSKVPVPNSPAVTLADYLPATEKTAWRNGKPAATLPELGKVIADDPDVHRCAVTRTWNWAMSRGDVVDDISPVPTSITTPLMEEFKANGFNMKKLIVKVFKSEDFTKF
jgi:hypothetical protein